jgi:hypothetical protein
MDISVKQVKRQRRSVLLKMFKEANPELMALSPIVWVDEIIESSTSENSEIILYDPPLLQITVQHPFVFNNRLVPSEFQGIKVGNFVIGKFPSEFPEPLTDITWEEYYAPERYRKFAKRKLALIRKKLKEPNLTEEEAVAALRF